MAHGTETHGKSTDRRCKLEDARVSWLHACEHATIGGCMIHQTIGVCNDLGASGSLGTLSGLHGAERSWLRGGAVGTRPVRRVARAAAQGLGMQRGVGSSLLRTGDC